MATLDTYRPYATSGRFSVANVVSLIATWNDRRATQKALGKLSDRELDDIGLTRGDIADI